MSRRGKIVHNALRSIMGMACLVVIGSASRVVADEKGPRLVLPESSFDFGSVPQGQRVVHEFVLQNKGDTDLTISRLSPSCGCTATTVSSPLVKPGASEKVRVEFDTSGFSGKKTKSVQIRSNSTDGSEVTVRLTGMVVQGVAVNPERLEFGQIYPTSSSQSRTREFVIEITEGSDLKPLQATTLSKYLSVTQVAAEHRRARYSVELKNGAPKGELRDRVIVEFEGDRQTAVNVPITASIMSDLRVVPSTVSFGIVGGDQVIERRLRFENKSDQKVSIDEIVSSHPAISATLVEVAPGKQGVVVVKLDPKKLSGDLKGSIDLKTSHPTEDRISLSVFGMQPPR